MVEFSHQPVMLAEILAAFEPLNEGVVVDATVGGGGHADAILEAHDALTIVGFDQDPDALEAAQGRLSRHGGRVQLCHARFDAMAAELERLGVASIVGVLFDLGVSSHQLDVADRGFSFRNPGPLDMRMNTTTGRSAADIINDADERDLADILSAYGDERHARRIARAILAARPIDTTDQLAEIVAEAMPAASRRTPGHPARRTFQALRIAVNDELGVLAPALHQAIEAMAPGARGAVLSYHSGEDRIVKKILRQEAGLNDTTPAHLPPPTEQPGRIDLLHRKGRTPSEEEIARNPRASAARLRTFERRKVAS